MKRLFQYAVVVSIACVTSAPAALALDIPRRPAGYVTDQANALSPQTRVRLDTFLAQYEHDTTNQVVVVVLPSLEGDSLEDFSVRLAEAWKAGQQGKDNGVIFLIFPNDRLMRIEVGYGLEGALPDALAGQIISQIVAPRFRAGQFDEGVLAGVAAIVKATQDESSVAAFNREHALPTHAAPRALTPEERAALEAKQRAILGGIFGLIALFFIIDLFRYRRYVHHKGLYRGGYSFGEWWFRFAILCAIFTILFRMLFYMMLFSRGGGYYGSRSGFGGGGGFSGGGGGFGGGGASGRW